MAPMGKFLKALFLGVVFRSKWGRSSKSRNKRGGQIFSVGDYSQDLDKYSSDDCLDDNDVFGLLGTVGTVGTVFWGQLADGSRIAVKKLNSSRTKGVKQFSAEAKLLGNIGHKNLLTVCGYCAEGKERLLVYEYMVNLSLHTHLHGSLSSSLILGWSRRMNIAIGAAEGLAYLHHRSNTIHGEIKSNNILLDANFNAKWGDFGLFRLMHESFLFKGGTEGMTAYYAPEYMKGGKRSSCGDVFGFGILLLELISGKKPWEKVGLDKKSMWEWAEPIIAEGRFSELVDPRLKGNYTRDALNLVVYVATMCAQSIPESRFTMMEAVEVLRCGKVCQDRDTSDEYVLEP